MSQNKQIKRAELWTKKGTAVRRLRRSDQSLRLRSLPLGWGQRNCLPLKHFFCIKSPICIFGRSKYGQVGCPWKILQNVVQRRCSYVNRTLQSKVMTKSNSWLISSKMSFLEDNQSSGREKTPESPFSPNLLNSHSHNQPIFLSKLDWRLLYWTKDTELATVQCMHLLTQEIPNSKVVN